MPQPALQPAVFYLGNKTSKITAQSAHDIGTVTDDHSHTHTTGDVAPHAVIDPSTTPPWHATRLRYADRPPCCMLLMSRHTAAAASGEGCARRWVPRAAQARRNAPRSSNDAVRSMAAIALRVWPPRTHCTTSVESCKRRTTRRAWRGPSSTTDEAESPESDTAREQDVKCTLPLCRAAGARAAARTDVAARGLEGPQVGEHAQAVELAVRRAARMHDRPLGHQQHHVDALASLHWAAGGGCA